MSGKEGQPPGQPPAPQHQQQQLHHHQIHHHQFQQQQQLQQPSVSITLTPAPVDLAKTTVSQISQIRIPSVPGTSIQRVGSIVSASGPRPTLIAPQVSVVAAPGRPMLGTVNAAKPSLSVSNITMLPNSGRMTSLSAVRPGTRPVLAAPQPTRVTSQQQTRATGPQPRSAIATPIIRGATGVQSLMPLQGGIVAHQVRTTMPTTGRIQSTPGSVQWTTIPTSSVAGRTVARPPTVVSVGARAVSMAALSFRPGLTVARPSGDARVTLASPVTAKALISPSGGIKPIGGVQTHIGVGISPQVGVASQVALKPSLPSPRATVGPGMPRAAARMVSPTPLVSLTPGTHIQVPLVPTGPKSRVQRMLTPSAGMSSTGSPVVGPVQLSTPRTITLPYSGQQVKSGAPATAGIPIARVPPQPSQAREGAGSGYVYLPVSRAADHQGRSDHLQLQQLVRGDPQQLNQQLLRNDQQQLNPQMLTASQHQQLLRNDPQLLRTDQQHNPQLLRTDQQHQQLLRTDQQHQQLLRSDPHQSAPVNLTMSDRTVRPPAMTMPSFTPTILYESGRAENSVTITTLPPSANLQPNNPAHQPDANVLQTGSASITPARITPIIPQQDQDKTVPGSPRPSILRKRDGEGTPVKIPPAPAGLSSPPHSPQRRLGTPPPRPNSSSGSSTVSVPSSAALSGDEQNAPPVQAAPHHQEPSPRKKPRKQQLPPPSAVNVSPEWLAVKREVSARDRLEWEGGRVLNSGEPGWEGRVSNWNSGTGRGWGQGWSDSKETDQADDEEEMTTDDEKDIKGSHFLKGKPMMTLKDTKPWKSRHNHFLRYSDVKSKDERRPTVNELANQKYVHQKMNGWKIFHLCAGMEDIIDMESELSKKLQTISKRIEESANEEVVLTKIQELLKANIQRSKVIQEQMKEAKTHSQSVFVHKPKMQDIIVKYHNKRPQRRTEK